MALRPGKCYRKVERPYTRVSRKKEKNYIKGRPHIKIHRFEVGEKKEFENKVYLVSKSNVQVRHNALEAMRSSITKYMGKNTKSYFLKILVYPHHILRENPLATGAGADRYQTGMRLAFGKPIGAAAIVKSGQKIAELRVEGKDLEHAKKALKIASSKLPMKCSIEIL